MAWSLGPPHASASEPEQVPSRSRRDQKVDRAVESEQSPAARPDVRSPTTVPVNWPLPLRGGVKNSSGSTTRSCPGQWAGVCSPSLGPRMPASPLPRPPGRRGIQQVRPHLSRQSLPSIRPVPVLTTGWPASGHERHHMSCRCGRLHQRNSRCSSALPGSWAGPLGNRQVNMRTGDLCQHICLLPKPGK